MSNQFQRGRFPRRVERLLTSMTKSLRNIEEMLYEDRNDQVDDKLGGYLEPSEVPDRNKATSVASGPGAPLTANDPPPFRDWHKNIHERSEDDTE